MLFSKKTNWLIISMAMTLFISTLGCSNSKKDTALKYTPLQYDTKALAPVISAKTVGLHHDIHYKGYVKRANKMLAESDFEGEDLFDILKTIQDKTEYKSLYNNLGQAINHDIYFKSLTPLKTKPQGELLKAINKSFGSFEEFREKFITKANAHFASGWVWLVKTDNGLKIITTQDSDNPVIFGYKPLLVIDLWEHAYYLDYQNKRKDYIEAVFTNLLNWKFAEENLK